MTKILVIEDDDLLRESIVECLMFEGFEVASAQDGVSGLESARATTPDLIVCDITMPRLGGYGVLAALQVQPTTAEIPFIFSSAAALPEEITRSLNAGAFAYITKPFALSEFLDIIQTVLTNKSPV